MTENTVPLFQPITCGICGKNAQQAALIGPTSYMCKPCADLFNKARTPAIYTLGWGANGTYLHEENNSAIQAWEEHMKACGWIKKRNRWVKKS